MVDANLAAKRDHFNSGSYRRVPDPEPSVALVQSIMRFLKPLDPDCPCGPQITARLRLLAHEVSDLMSVRSEAHLHEAIHEARRCLKAIMALIGLLRRSANKRHLRSMWMMCREALHGLGTLRDPHVIEQILPTIEEQVLENRKLIDWWHVRKTVRRLLKEVIASTQGLRTRHGRRHACKALNRSWEKAARSAEHAQEKPNAISLHTLRHHAIRLRLQVIFMSGMSDISKKEIDSLISLCSELGDHHDLAMAMTHAHHGPDSILYARSMVLQRSALKRTRHLFRAC